MVEQTLESGDEELRCEVPDEFLSPFLETLPIIGSESPNSFVRLLEESKHRWGL